MNFSDKKLRMNKVSQFLSLCSSDTHGGRAVYDNLKEPLVVWNSTVELHRVSKVTVQYRK